MFVSVLGSMVFLRKFMVIKRRHRGWLTPWLRQLTGFVIPRIWMKQHKLVRVLSEV